MSHIEFLSETFGVVGVFDYALGESPKYKLHSLRNWHKVEDNMLVDMKYGEKIPLNNSVWLYNAETNVLQQINVNKVGVIIATLPEVPRHWLQLGETNMLRESVLKIMPRLEYAFKRWIFEYKPSFAWFLHRYSQL